MLLACFAAVGLIALAADPQSLIQEADRLHQKGHWAESAKAYRRFEAHNDPKVRFHVLNRIAVAELNLGELTSAERTMKRTLQLLESAPNHAPEMMGVLFANMGSLYLRRGQLSKAEDVLRRSVAILESVHGKGDLQTIRARDNFAVALVQQGKLKDAKELLEYSVAKSPDPSNPDMAATFVNLALVVTDLGETARAEELYKSVMAVLPPTHSDYPKVLFSLGRFYRAQKRWAEAARTYLSAAQAIEQAVGTDGYLYALVAYEYLDLPKKVADKERVKITRRAAEAAIRAHERDERRPNAVDYQDLIRTYR